jgi:hypothetical protein
MLVGADEQRRASVKRVMLCKINAQDIKRYAEITASLRKARRITPVNTE